MDKRRLAPRRRVSRARRGRRPVATIKKRRPTWVPAVCVMAVLAVPVVLWAWTQYRDEQHRRQDDLILLRSRINDVIGETGTKEEIRIRREVRRQLMEQGR